LKRKQASDIKDKLVEEKTAMLATRQTIGKALYRAELPEIEEMQFDDKESDVLTRLIVEKYMKETGADSHAGEMWS